MKFLLLFVALQTPHITKMPLPAKTIRDTTKNYIVIHNDGAGMTAQSTHQVLRRRGVSYHYFIDKQGKIYQFVDTKYVAKHAGVSMFDGLFNWNKFSIGICLQGKTGDIYSDKQYESLQILINQLQVKYSSIGTQLYTHEEIAFPYGRKHDPGDTFVKSKITLNSKIYHPVSGIY